MTFEPLLLDFKWAMIPIAIESRFADRNDALPPNQILDEIPVLRLRFVRIIGLNPSSRPDMG